MTEERDRALARVRVFVAMVDKAFAEGARTVVDAQARGIVCDDKMIEEAWRHSRTLKSLKALG
jgi:hypothetical protein